MCSNGRWGKPARNRSDTGVATMPKSNKKNGDGDGDDVEQNKLMENSMRSGFAAWATRGRIVPLAPPVPVTAASSEGNLTESIEKLFNEGNDAEKEHSTGGGKYAALTKAIVEHVNKDVAEKPRWLKKTRKVARDASSSTMPPKKIREDYGTSGTSASTGGKSRAAMQSLLDSSKLAAKIRVTAATTVPLVTSFVSLMLEREEGDHTDSVSGPNLQTKPAVVRFVISSDSSHHSGTHFVDVEVFSLVRSTVLDPSVMTAAVTTTAVVETSLVSVSKVTVKQVNPTLFGDSMSTSGHDVAGPSSPVHPELSADSFYAIHYLNPKTLHRLYTEFNVEEARMTCLGAEVWMRPEHTLRKKKIMKEECAKKTNLLKEKDAEIASLKSQLSLKEAEAAEAIRPRGHVATVEATKSLHVVELNLLKERNSTLEAKMYASEEKAATTCVKLHNQVVGYELFKEQIKVVHDEQVRVLTEKIAKVDANLMRMALQLDDEFYPRYLTTIAGRRWILICGLKPVVTRCLQSPEYLSVLGKAFGRAVDKGMQDGLVAGIEHGKAGRALNDVSAYFPFADVIYVAAVSALRDVDFSLLTLLASQKDDSIADIMDSLCLEGPVAETPNRIRIDAKARRLSLSDTRVPLIEPLSSKNLLGEASTFGVPVTVDVVTTLSTSFAGSVSVSVPPLSVADYGAVHVGPQVEDPSSGGIVFEKEKMETSPKPVAGS
nr:protein suppressor of K(+) transport growth defect 1-like [Tanacetum cinerariifolium]